MNGLHEHTVRGVISRLLLILHDLLMQAAIDNPNPWLTVECQLDSTYVLDVNINSSPRPHDKSRLHYYLAYALQVAKAQRSTIITLSLCGDFPSS